MQNVELMLVFRFSCLNLLVSTS